MGGCVENTIRLQTGFKLFDHLTSGVDQELLGSKVLELSFVPAR